MKNQERNVLRMPEELIEDMNAHLPGDLTIQDIQRLMRGKRFKVYFTCSEALMNTDVTGMLDLSVRSSNALKRAGIETIGDLIRNLKSFEDLRRIRNCGATCVAEISGKAFFYQYAILPKERRSAYMEKILEINGIRLYPCDRER